MSASLYSPFIPRSHWLSSHHFILARLLGCRHAEWASIHCYLASRALMTRLSNGHVCQMEPARAHGRFPLAPALLRLLSGQWRVERADAPQPRLGAAFIALRRISIERCSALRRPPFTRRAWPSRDAGDAPSRARDEVKKSLVAFLWRPRQGLLAMNVDADWRLAAGHDAEETRSIW